MNDTEKLRYNRAFKKGLAVIFFCIALFGSMVVFFIVSQIQYNQLTANMEPLEATIVDIDLDIRTRGPDVQEIYIEYEVDGAVYNRELETDTAISFEAGTGAWYSIGDKIPILYDPQNPEIIAVPRSQSVGIFRLIFALISLALVLFVLILVLKTRRRYLVTQEEYDAEKRQKKQIRKETKETKKLKRKNRHPKARKVWKIIWIVLGSIVGAFILYILFGLLLILLGY